MNPYPYLRPTTDAELLGQSSALLLGAALIAWALCAIGDLLDRGEGEP